MISVIYLKILQQNYHLSIYNEMQTTEKSSELYHCPHFPVYLKSCQNKKLKFQKPLSREKTPRLSFSSETIVLYWHLASGYYF